MSEISKCDHRSRCLCLVTKGSHKSYIYQESCVESVILEISQGLCGGSDTQYQVIFTLQRLGQGIQAQE